MLIRTFVDGDWSRVWPIVSDVARAANTFALDPSIDESQARAMWIEPGPGAHVSTASFMVAADRRGRGIGRTLCANAIDRARERAYAGM